MKFKEFYSTQSDISQAIADITTQTSGFESALVLYFASSHYNTAILSSTMQAAFGKTPAVGCTTSGELVSGQMLDNSIVGICFGKESLRDVQIELLTNISTDTQVVDKAFKHFENHLGISMNTANAEKYVGLLLIDGLSGKEEKINERVGDLTNVAFIGGSAGDDLAFAKTFVFANGQAYSDAALLVLLEPALAFSVLKTQSFVASGKVLKTTKVDEAHRKVIEFNGKPALEAYAEALGVSKDQVEGLLFKNPVGIVFSPEDIFVRSPRLVEGDSIYFYCGMKEGMEFEVLHSTHIIEDTRQALADKIKTMKGVSGLLNFHCILRTLDLKGQNKTAEYGQLFSDIPSVGFSTYGESYLSHINQTSTMLVFSE